MPAAPRRFTIHSLSAMAEGLVVVAPDGTTEDYLVDGATAALFDPGVPNSLYDKLSDLLEDRSSARRIAHAAQDYMRSYHQASAMVSATAHLYRELCGKASPALSP
jgi:glycosyltransferase involved in cell wall biosynthesis